MTMDCPFRGVSFMSFRHEITPQHDVCEGSLAVFDRNSWLVLSVVQNAWQVTLCGRDKAFGWLSGFRFRVDGTNCLDR